MLDVSHHQIWRWEQEKNDPSDDFIVRLARILGSSTDYLLGMTDDPKEVRQEEDLTPDERRLLDAYRTGRIWELLRIVNSSAPSETDNESGIIASKPAVQG